MRQRLFIFSFFLVFSLLAWPRFEAFAKVVTSSAGNFSVQMPGTPKVSQKDHKSFIGKVPETSYELKLRNSVYIVSFSDLPGAALFFDSAQGVMKKAKKNFLKELGAKEVRYNGHDFVGYPGSRLFFRITAGDSAPQQEGLAQFFMVEKRLYILVMIRSPKISPNLANRYFKSFRFLKKPT